MIQFNLLPDVKLEYLKARKSKRLIMLTAAGVSAVAVTILLLLTLYVNVAQKKHLRDLNTDVKKYQGQLNTTADLNKILTIQNQLSSLPKLHGAKPVTSRLFGYIAALTPAQANISKLSVDFEAHTISITGTADSLSTVNKFTDTLKFTTYASSDQTTTGPAFSSIVLSSFSRDEKTASYSIDAAFDPIIFDNASDIALSVPKIISTRSETEKPAALFQP